MVTARRSSWPILMIGLAGVAGAFALNRLLADSSIVPMAMLGAGFLAIFMGVSMHQCETRAEQDRRVASLFRYVAGGGAALVALLALRIPFAVGFSIVAAHFLDEPIRRACAWLGRG